MKRFAVTWTWLGCWMGLGAVGLGGWMGAAEASHLPGPPPKPDLVVEGTLRHLHSITPHAEEDLCYIGTLEIDEVIQGHPDGPSVELLFIKRGEPGRSDGLIAHQFAEDQAGTWSLLWNAKQGVYVPLVQGPNGGFQPFKKPPVKGPKIGVIWDADPTRRQVEAVKPASAADRARLKPGDVIVAVEQRPIATRQAFETIVIQAGSGAKIKIQVIRNKQPVELLLHLPVESEPVKPAPAEPPKTPVAPPKASTPPARPDFAE